MLNFLKKIFGSAQSRILKRYRKVVVEINQNEEKLQSLSDEALKAKTEEFKARVQKGETLDALLPEAYAVVKNACRRLCGTEVHVSGYDQKWDMIPYDVQLVSGIAMHYGCIAEMMTGEGKTLTAVLPLYLNALKGESVHLVTVNDYLAKRDCEWVGAVLRWLGLKTAALTNDVHPVDRHDVYESDVVYGTASEFGFDYLRDNSMAMMAGEQVQKGHFFALIDEVDSILIDEARTPLIISGPVPESQQMYSELKGGVSTLVRKQRDRCNAIASEARNLLKSFGVDSEKTEIDDSLSKEKKEELQQAYHRLWLVSKGTPRNRTVKRLLENPDVRAAVDQWDLYYYSEQGKEEKIKVLSELLIIVDERGSDYELTDKGIQEWEKVVAEGQSDDFVMLDLGYEYAEIDNDDSLDDAAKMQKKLEIQEEDGKRKERAHNLRQLLRAHLLMERDVDYIVQEQKIVIIDEHTGRPQPGRRFSDGLHQAIEAKEGVEIQKESQTYATITLQNYFRMYEKLSGMTGTAITEAQEFKEIYKLEALEIPTHKPCVREDFNDEVYMTEREKYTAILKDIKENHEKDRPILIGTESVEVSEKLSRVLKQNKLEHTVLNARHHESEAEIVAAAGQKGAITIATNMAGRGTDIKLGDGVAQCGGLHVVGSTRHSSRRIDRQLRGRCARQGDPGTSRFYVSFEDQLMRLFASPKLTAMLQRFRPPEGEAISASILNRSIETAQKRVEQRNYMARKHTLEYDDVMNKQRQEIYAFRNNVLWNENPCLIAEELLEDLCYAQAEHYFRDRVEEGGWDSQGFRQWLMTHFPLSFSEDAFDDDHLEPEEIAKKAYEQVLAAFRSRLDAENTKALAIAKKLVGENQDLMDTPANEAVRMLILRRLDGRWKEHLLTMDHLRSEVGLRAVAQRDPLQEFKHEAFSLFDTLGQELREEIGQMLFKFRIVVDESAHSRLDEMLAQLRMEKSRSLFGDMQGAAASAGSQPAQATNQQRGQVAQELEGMEQGGASTKLESITSTEPKVKRNEPCPCGSGKKYKKCCEALDQESGS